MSKSSEMWWLTFGVSVGNVGIMWIVYLLFVLFTKTIFDELTLVFASMYVFVSSMAIFGYFISKVYELEDKLDKK